MSYTDYMEGLGFNMDMTRRLTGQPVTPETSQPATAAPNPFKEAGMQSFSEANPDLVGMPTEQQLMAAMRNAHNAGDTAAAKRFAGMIEKVRNPNDYSGLVQGLDAAQSGLMSIAEGGLRLPQLATDTAFQLMGRDVSQGYEGSGEDILNYFNSMADSIAEKSKDINYVQGYSWQKVKDNPTPENIIGYMGEGLASSLPSMAAVMLSAPGYWATLVAPGAQKRAENNGRKTPTPGDVAAAMVSALGMATAERYGAKGIFGGVGGNIATRPIKAGLRESATEAIQNPIQYAGETLGTDKGFDPAVALDQAAAGAVAGFGAGTGIRGTIDVGNAVINPSSMGNPDNQPTDPQAAADFARDIEAVAQEKDFDLKDVSKTSTKGARQALDLLHVRYDGDMQRLRNVLKDQLKLKDTDPEIVQIDKMLAQLAYREARTKTKNVVGNLEFAALDRLVGNTKEGSELINVMRKTNELTELHNAGFQGGISQFTDQFAPFGVGISYDRGAQKAEMMLRPLISGGIATNTYGLSLLGQTAAVGAGRAIDAVTGNRSKVNKYVKQNRKGEGMTSLTEPSILEQAQALEARNNEAEQLGRQDAYIRGNLPTAGSPEATMIIATGGLPTEVIMEIARDVAARDPNLAQPARDFIDSVTGQYPVTAGKFPGLNNLIREIKTVAANNPEYSQLANPQLAAQLSENYTTPVPVMGGSTPTGVAPAPRDVSAGYVRGIEANREAADRLADEVSNDTTISPRDKVVLLNALEDLRGNLGLDPVNRAQEIGVDAERSLSDPALADKYLMPYINRVAGQQEGGDVVDAMAVPEFGEGQAVRPVPPKQSVNVLGAYDPEGQYVAMPSGEVISGNTYDGARIYINPNGFGGMEVDATQQQDAKPDKSFGKRFKTNLFKKFNVSKNGKKTNELWTWVNQPDGNTRTDNEQEFLVAFVSDNKHYYTTDLQANVPTELDKDRGNINAGNQPFLRPSGYGEFNLGEPIGYIRTGRGNIHPVYDQIRVEPKDGRNGNVIDSAKTPMLNQPNGEQLSTEFDPTAKTEMGFLPFLRVRTDKKYDHPRKILASSNPKNAARQIEALDQLLADHPNTLASPDAFMDYLADAMGKANKDGSVPLIPFRALEMVQNPQMVVEQIGGLTPGQRELAAEGFSAAEQFREAYTSGSAHADITGKLLLWGILSRGVSPYIQEAMFLDIVTDRGNKQGIGKHIQDAADGTFDIKEYLKWVKRTVPENTPGSGSTHNLNAFGKTLLRKMSIKDPETGITPMQRLHDLMASDLSGRDVRREFHKINTGVGINNKVLSFMLLVSGRNDVMVLDRIQFRNMFDDGRFDGFNIYDPTKIDKKQIAGSSIQSLGDDTMGLMIYEALERDLAPTIQAAYEQLGRGADFSMGRYHWESWVASSAQEVDHGTISGIINEAMGLPNPYDHITTREGRYNRFDSGAVYGYNPQTGQPYIQLPDGLGNMFEFTPDGAAKVLDRIRKKKKSDGIIPKDFSVSESLEGAYYERPEVNKENLSRVLKEEGGQLVSRGVQQTSEDNTSIDRATNPIYTPAAPVIRGSRPATQEEIRDQLGIAEQLFADGKPIPIGQKGSEFENGISDRRVAGLIANALGYSFEIFANPTRMNKDAKARFNPKGLNSKDFNLGFLAQQSDPNRKSFDRVDKEETPGKIYVLGAYKNPKDSFKQQSLEQSVFTALHELGHGIERLPSKGSGYVVRSFDRSPAYIGVNDKRVELANDRIYEDTFRDYLTQVLAAADGGKIKPSSAATGEIINIDQETAKAIRDEVIDMQRFGTLTVAMQDARPNSDINIRNTYVEAGQAVVRIQESEGYTNAEKQAKIDRIVGRVTDFERYTQSPQEMAADMIGMYLVDPKGFKRKAPTAANFVATLLNRSKSPSSKFVQFYSAPFAAVLAAIMANMLVGLEEDEEEKGVLALGQGALSI